MQRHNYSFDALGTRWNIETDRDISTHLKQKIQRRVEEFDVAYSRFRKDSLVAKLAQHSGTYTFPNDADELMSFYKKLYTLTDGKVTPLIGQVLSNAGYDANYSFTPQPQQAVHKWEEAMEWQGSRIKTKAPVLLDVGAAGKGYLVDSICHLLDANGVETYVVDASGDLRHKGDMKNVVGLEHPFDTSKVIGAIDIQNKSLCASAVNRRIWGEGMHHVFDPSTLKPTSEIIATWVLADEAMVADGIATALFFVSPQTIASQFMFEFIRVHANGTLEYSPFFESCLFDTV